jgi:phage gpG-like protein
MKDVSISIDYDDSKTQEYLASMMARSTSFVSVFLYSKELLALSNAENFTSSGLPVGGWSPRRDRYAWPIMRRTGKLFSSLSTLSGPANVIGPNSASFGTTIEYAKFHQYGTRKMAKRKILFEPEGFARQVGDAAASHVVRGALFGK